MENRKLIIGYYGIEWDIKATNYDENRAKGLKIVKPITSVMGGKIVEIFDILTPYQEDIEEAKEYKEFYEVCDFEVLSNGHKFTGTFIDALEYIKDNFDK
ncbi:hypothetical protein ABC405_000666 [Campylobacter fetus]|uniref:hypothetical protein n=1 Tax=Campylobacter fetus TaxID=196 RepID=UPI00081879B5|nr:hypothetical protein [Campylobacter fetus]EAH8299632.1 hypothetical protein [Campylobacter fetus]EAI7232230.1 hypothetical protein [Campylobacter fetus]EAJ5690945.1 hypothetical protein [Campylobacter fetus]EAK0427737.1 hypothetical protein [Campylobacter fetus]EAK5305433.1 hypothetical protein [Campylobacter fetus]